jgi:hypothetical protein
LFFFVARRARVALVVVVVNVILAMIFVVRCIRFVQASSCVARSSRKVSPLGCHGGSHPIHSNPDVRIRTSGWNEYVRPSVSQSTGFSTHATTTTTTTERDESVVERRERREKRRGRR